jgi:hypothetical protein
VFSRDGERLGTVLSMTPDVMVIGRGSKPPLRIETRHIAEEAEADRRADLSIDKEAAEALRAGPTDAPMPLV